MPGRWRNLAGLLAFSSILAQSPLQVPNLVLKFDVDLVQVDAIVTDSHGAHISALRAEDFAVLQDGKPQKITHFSYIAAESAAIATIAPAASPRVPGPPPTKAEVGRTLVFLLDDAGMSFSDFHYAQDAIARYIDEALQPSDIVAVARTSYGSGALQVFTSDSAWLRSALRRMLWRPPLETLQTHPLLSSLTRAIAALAQYPGRKSVVLISPGLPAGNPGEPAPDYWTAVRHIADSANRASVTIETIDCRGLPTLQPSAADPMPSNLPDRTTGMTPQMRTSWDYFHSQDVLSFLAAATAGRFQRENNDIAGQVRNAAEDSSGYYLIGWYPGAQAFQRKVNRPLDYHRVKISLRNQKGLSVRTRDGFFSFAGDNTKVAYSPAQQMNEALFSPFRSGDIDVRLTSSLGYDERDGAYIESLLHIRPTGVTFHEVPGRSDCKLADLEILTSPEPLDSEKVPIGHIDGESAQIQVCKKLDGLLTDGLVVSVRKQIPVPGPYQMRVAVRNIQEGDGPSIGPKALIRRPSMEPDRTAIGSANQIVEVPDTRKQNIVLTGITLRSGTFLEPVVNGGLSYRIASPSDPAVRQFHPGETLTYSFRLLRSDKKAEAAEYRLRVLHDGKEFYVAGPRAAKPGDLVTGAYTVDPSAPAGQYLLGVSAGSATQWIDFEVSMK